MHARNRTTVAQELQQLVQRQQEDLQAQQQLQQAEQPQASPLTAVYPDTTRSLQTDTANAELRQQLHGATTRLQQVEAAIKQLLDQQVEL